MIYIEYEEAKRKFYKAKTDYIDLIDQKEALFIKTLPSAVEIKEDKITSSKKSNPFEEYVIEKEKINLDNRIEESINILENREKIFNLKKDELLSSKDWNDVIYTYYYIKMFSIRKTSKYVPFSKSEVHNKITEIRKKIKTLDKSGQK